MNHSVYVYIYIYLFIYRYKLLKTTGMRHLKILDLGGQSDFEDYAHTSRLCTVKCSRESVVKGEFSVQGQEGLAR